MSLWARETIDSRDLYVISFQVRSAYDTTFMATNALIVTWERATDSSMAANTFQVVLATDMRSGSYVIYNFGECESGPDQLMVSYVQVTDSPTHVMINWDNSVFNDSLNEYDNDYLIYNSSQTNVDQPGRFVYPYRFTSGDYFAATRALSACDGSVPVYDSTNSTDAPRADAVHALWFLYVVSAVLVLVIVILVAVLGWLVFSWRHIFKRLPDEEALTENQIEMNDEMSADWQSPGNTGASVGRSAERYRINENEL